MQAGYIFTHNTH